MSTNAASGPAGAALGEKVLIVDDEPDWLAMLASAVKAAGFAAVAAGSAEEALERIHGEPLFLVLSDLMLPEADGIELCRRVRAERPDLPFVLVTGKADRDRAIEGLRAGITDIVDKPFSHESVKTLIWVHAAKRLERLELERQEAEALLSVFLDEAREQMAGIADAILRLEQDPRNMEEINRLFRKVHTIKGSSGAIKKAEPLTPLAHAIETVLNRLKEGLVQVRGPVVDVLLSATDLLAEQLRAVETDAAMPDAQAAIAALADAAAGKLDAAAPGATPRRAADKSDGKAEPEHDGGVYVPAETLDALMETAGELIAVKNAFHTLYREPGNFSPTARSGAKDVAETLDKVSERIQAQLMQARKVAMKKVFAKLPRIVRQVGVEVGKEVALELQGQDVSVDKSIANVLSGCLSHAVRNALDHGLETPAERQALGKPALGRLTVKAEDRQGLVVVVVADDGRGIDRARVLAKAVERGLVAAHDAERLGDDEILRFIFHPGFSTAAAVTNISGRGVGMDAIQTAVWACGGTIDIQSVPGQGTTLTLSIPVVKTINVERAVLVEARGTTYAVPLKSVSTIGTVRASEITPLKEHLSFQYMGKALRLATYADLLPETRPRAARERAGLADKLVVVLTAKSQAFGFEIDRVVGQFDAVVRPLSRLVRGLPGFEGTAVVGGGKIALVISAEEMVKMAASRGDLTQTQTAEGA
jgi:two-component system chemotaxis sensor kinase CheA